jgi:hypothetical protein
MTSRLAYVWGHHKVRAVAMNRPVALGAKRTIGLIGGAATALVVFLVLVPGPINPGVQTLQKVGSTVVVPAATNYTPGSATDGWRVYFGGPGEVFVEFNLSYTSAIAGTLSAPRPFNLTLGNAAYTEEAACTRPTCPAPAGPSVGYSTSSGTIHLDLGALSLHLVGPNNQIPEGSWWIVLYNDGYVPDPIQVTGAITATPVQWY